MAFPLPAEHNAGGSMVPWIWAFGSIDYIRLLPLYYVLRIVTMQQLGLLFSYPNLKAGICDNRENDLFL